MESLGMNLVVALDALLTENSVTAAAERLHASAPALAADPASIVRTFDLQVSDVFATTVMAQLITDVRTLAPGITLRFRPTPWRTHPRCGKG